MSTRTWIRWLPNGFSLTVIVLLAANYFSTFGDLDYTWQIRTGEIIVRTGDLRPPDHFSYTMPGQDLPDFEWLYQVILWFLWTHFGYGGLKLLKTVLVSATLLLVAWRLRVARVRWHGIALALTLAVAVLTPAWNLRALYCTTLGLLLVSGWLHDHCNSRRALPWLLPVVMLLWANLHPAVITGQALLLGAIAWEWLNRWLHVNAPLDTSALKRLTLVGGLGLCVTFVSPDPVQRLLYPFQPNLAHPIQRVFVEMQPLYSTLTKAPYTSGVIYVVAALVLLSIVLRFRHYRVWEIMMLAALAALANTASRAAQDWLLIMLALGVPHLVILFRQAVHTDRRRSVVRWLLRCDSAWRRAWDSPMLRVQSLWPVAAVLLLAVVSLIPPWSRRMPMQDDRDWPAAALTYLQHKGIHGNFFGPPDYGAYVTWRLGEHAHCYADTRGFFYPPILLEDSHFVPQLGPQWRERLNRVLDDYATDYFVLETTGPRGELWRCLQPHVGNNVVYLDEQTVVLTAGAVRQGIGCLELAKK
jgi:hypothetical protein